VYVDKEMISPHNEWYIGNVLFCAHFSSKLAHGTYCFALSNIEVKSDVINDKVEHR